MKRAIQAIASGTGLALVALACGNDAGTSATAPRSQTRAEAHPQGWDAEDAQRQGWGAADAQRASNRSPQIVGVALQPAQPVAGDLVTAVVDARDEDGDVLRFGYAWRVAGRPMPGDGRTFRLGDVEKGDPVQVTVTASDGRAESAPVSTALAVANRPPTLTGVALEPLGEVNVSNDVVARPQAIDPDGDPVEYRYAWMVNGRPVLERGPRLEAKRFRRGDEIRVRVTASDGEGDSAELVSAPIRVGNAPPQIDSFPSGVDADGTFHYVVESRDPDGDRSLRYRLAKGPEGMSVDSISGRVHWTPGSQQTGSFDVEVVVEDLQGGSTSQRFNLRVEDDGDGAVPAAPAP